MIYIVNPVCRLLWLPCSREPHSIAFFSGNEKEVIEGLSIEEIREIRCLLNGNLKVLNSNALFLLEKKGVIYKSYHFESYDFSSMFSRQIISYCNHTNFDKAIYIHNEISETTFVIIGVGGAGSNAIHQLLSMGASNFILIDPDIVELSNLNRQILFTKDSVGKPKVLEARRYIQSFSSNKCHVKTLQEDITITDDLDSLLEGVKKMFVVSSADSNQVDIRRYIASVFYSRKVPYIFLGYYGATAKIGPMVIDHGAACGACDSFIFDFDNVMELAFGDLTKNIAPSSLSINSVLASLFSNMVVQWLAGEVHENQICTFDLITFESEVTTIKKRHRCEICGNTKNV